MTLANATLPYMLKLADKGFERAVKEDPLLRKGMTCWGGKLTLKETALKQNRHWTDAEELIKTGRRLYSHVNDRCGPPYTIVLDDDYAEYCPWMKSSKPAGKTWSPEMTDAAVELFESEKGNREQRRKKREERKKNQ